TSNSTWERGFPHPLQLGAVETRLGRAKNSSLAGKAGTARGAARAWFLRARQKVIDTGTAAAIPDQGLSKLGVVRFPVRFARARAGRTALERGAGAGSATSPAGPAPYFCGFPFPPTETPAAADSVTFRALLGRVAPNLRRRTHHG